MATLKYSNSIYANSRSMELNFIFLAKNLTNNKVALFTLPVTGQDPLSGISKRYINFSSNPSFIKGANGQTASVLSQDENDPTGELSITFKVDKLGEQNGQSFGQYKNIYEIMVNGQTFNFGGAKWVVVGTNGTLMTSRRANKCQLNKSSAGNIFKNYYDLLMDGQAIDENGEQVFTSNVYRTSYDILHKPFVLETYELLGNGTETSLICSYLTAPELEETFSEDANTYTMTGMRCCDIQISEQSILKGAKYSYAIADENKKTFEVDYIVQSATLILGSEGADGETLLMVHPTTGVAQLYLKVAGAWVAQTAGGSFSTYAQVTANKSSTSTLALATEGRVMVVATATVGTDNTFTATNSVDGVGTADYVYKFYVMDRDTGDFAVLTQEATC